MNNQIKIIQFTDPVCTWCWGSEPIIRKLQWRFGDQIEVSYIMGGLVNDIREFYDHANDIGGDPKESNENIARHWLEASQKHGMPIRTEGFQLFTEEHPSSYPQNIAYKAAQIQDQELANKFLRRMREATATEARQTNRRDELVGLASEVGLDIASFIKSLEDGSARQAFEQDLRIASKYLVRSFPSFRLVYGTESMNLHGFQSYDTLKAIFRNITNDTITERPVQKSAKSVLQFINRFESVAPVEIKKAFDLSENEMDSLVTPLINQDTVRKVWAGNGYLIRPTKEAMACDPESGVCTV